MDSVPLTCDSILTTHAAPPALDSPLPTPDPVRMPANPPEKTAVLLLQLGTPEAPTPQAVGTYLREFLWDPRVIEAPRALWWFVLNCRIIPRRKHESAAKYKRIWDPKLGSPLLHWTQEQASLLGVAMREALDPVVRDTRARAVRDTRGPGAPEVRYAMRYGRPSTSAVVGELLESGVRRILAVPMYPQYSATTVASALDGFYAAVSEHRHGPAVRVAPPFSLAPGYLDALAAAYRRYLETLDWRPEKTLISFHGIPRTYIDAGDPYREQCLATAAALVPRLGLSKDQYLITFQSRFGKQEWLTPYTDLALVDLARNGVRRVVVIQPGFVADCLETVDEIGREAREFFQHAGGTHFGRVPCLNADGPWIDFLRDYCVNELSGWLP